ncbi:No_hits_found [Calothrix sp. PCC 7716]|nr:No_hits_found [Calothrix sp. PCC 7716]BDA69302.1 No_hits_found [Calothrix sp. PCC 7716]
MTAFSKTQLPNSVDTLEELAVWAILSLSHINSDLIVIEGAGSTERAAQAGVFYVESDKKYRFLGRVSVEMSKNYLSGNDGMWNYAQPLSSVEIPTIFTA